MSAISISLGAAILHESLTIGLAIGFPAVVIGSILGTSRAKKPDPQADQVPAAAD